MQSRRGLWSIGLCESFIGLWIPCNGGWRLVVGELFQGGGFFLVGCKLPSQTKVNFSHCVDSWVRVPHDREDLSHGAGVLFHIYMLDGIVVSRKDACADLVSKYF